MNMPGIIDLARVENYESLDQKMGDKNDRIRGKWCAEIPGRYIHEKWVQIEWKIKMPQISSYLNVTYS